jgi:nitrite reductase (NADH) large subunit
MRIAIVGCGVAGFTAASATKQSLPDAKVSVYTDENHLYYPRPRLYEVLCGERLPKEIYAHDQQWYEKQGISLHLNKKAIKIDANRKEIVLHDGSKADYDKLLLANGAHPFMPPIKGEEKTGVFTLRTIEDALTIREYARKTKKAIVLGGGLLGLESAAYLTKLCSQVEVVEIHARLLPTQLDQDGASILKNYLENLNIRTVLGVEASEILGRDAVSGVSLDNGDEVSGGLVLMAAGVRPNVDLAATGGIKVNKGVVVDQYLRTSVDDIYAAGDVCEFQGKVYGIIPPAIEQAKTASINMLNEDKQVYKGSVQHTALKIAGISITSIGMVNIQGPQYEEIKKIDEKQNVYKKLVLDQGKIVGAILLGNTKGASPIMKLIDQQKDIMKYKEQILEDDFDYEKIAE